MFLLQSGEKNIKQDQLFKEDEMFSLLQLQL